ncbi:MAG: fatty acid desaturase [Pseudomonadota bacterium]|nr:fatty acid desaturase [Pseudomonadota bacterium]
MIDPALLAAWTPAAWLFVAAFVIAVAAWTLPLHSGIREDATPGAEAATRQAARLVAQRSGIDLAAFRRPTPWALAGLLVVPLCWVIGIAGIAAGGLLAVAGILVAAFALNALFLVIHEAVHETLPGPSRVGHLLASAIGLIGFASHASYRIMHLRHHRYLGDHRDPDDYRNWTSSPRRLMLMHYARLALATLSYLVAVPLLAWRFASVRERRWILSELAAMIVLHTVGVVFFGARWWLFVLPPLAVANLLINARGLVQHTACVAEDPMLASRSVLAGPLVRTLLLNENHHLEHHLFPSVPACRLHELHRAIAPALGAVPTSPSYHGFVLRFIAASVRGQHGPLL